MGVGGDTSWHPKVHPEFLLDEKQYQLNFTFQPLDLESP
jgi:beta-galactosidase